MTKTEFRNELAFNLGISQTMCKTIFADAIESLRNMVANGQKPKLPRLGTFTVYLIAAREMYNPALDDYIIVPLHYGLKFTRHWARSRATNPNWRPWNTGRAAYQYIDLPVANHLHTNYGHDLLLANRLFYEMISLIINTAATGEKVPIDRLGTFKIKNCAARRYKNISTGTFYDKPAYTKINFRPCEELKALAN